MSGENEPRLLFLLKGWILLIDRAHMSVEDYAKTELGINPKTLKNWKIGKYQRTSKSAGTIIEEDIPNDLPNERKLLCKNYLLLFYDEENKLSAESANALIELVNQGFFASLGEVAEKLINIAVPIDTLNDIRKREHEALEARIRSEEEEKRKKSESRLIRRRIKREKFFVYAAVWLTILTCLFFFGRHYNKKSVFGDSKYSLSRDLLTWPDAREKCRDNGGYLAVIESEEENEFILEFFYQTIGENYCGAGPWIGLNDSDVEGVFTWEDGTALDGQFQGWSKNEPNNERSSKKEGGEDCVLLDYQCQNGWNDAVCSEQNYFICEKKVGFIGRIIK